MLCMFWPPTTAALTRMAEVVGIPLPRTDIRVALWHNPLSVSGMAYPYEGRVVIRFGILSTQTQREAAILHEFVHCKRDDRGPLLGHGREFRRALLAAARTWFLRDLPGALARLPGSDYTFDRALVRALGS